jgi:hypothetical protein
MGRRRRLPLDRVRRDLAQGCVVPDRRRRRVLRRRRTAHLRATASTARWPARPPLCLRPDLLRFLSGRGEIASQASLRSARSYPRGVCVPIRITLGLISYLRSARLADSRWMRVGTSFALRD